jgi:hypothetical protein
VRRAHMERLGCPSWRPVSCHPSKGFMGLLRQHLADRIITAHLATIVSAAFNHERHFADAF